MLKVGCDMIAYLQNNYEEDVVTKFPKKSKSECGVVLNSSNEDFNKEEEWYIGKSTDDFRCEVHAKNDKEGKTLKKVTFYKQNKTLVHPKKKTVQQN